ncbi:MAG: hypothetical protein AAB965_00630 [Patescibacteria group bacterium]
MRKKIENKKWIFSDETMKGLAELAEAVKAIDDRLLRDGYVIKDGKLVKINDIPL